MSVRSKPNREGEAPAEPERDTVELSEGWTSAGFMEVFDIQGGTQPPKSEFVYEPTDGYIRLLQIRDFGEKPVPTYIRQKPSLKTCTADDVLIGRYGASVGRICTGMEGAYNVALTKVIIPDGIDRRFAFFLLNSDAFQRPLLEIERSAQDGFNKEDLAEIRLPLAPLAEQRRIVGKLELLLGKVSSSQQRLSRVPGLLKRFRQSVLAAASSGKLTTDWREENEEQDAEAELRAVLTKTEQRRGTAEPTEGRELLADAIPSSWQLPRIEEVFRIIDYRGRNPEKAAHGKRIITAKNIRMGYLSDEPIEFISDETYAEWMTRGFPRKGDIFFVTEGATMGFVALNTRDDEFALAQRTLTLQPFDETLGTKAFFYFTMSKLFQDLVALNATGSAAVGIKGAKFRDLPIPFPPLAEQQEIVRRVEKLFAFADQIEARQKQAQSHVDRLTQSLLAKAFRGELVPTEHALATAAGRDYEPASALLARLKESSQQISATKSKRSAKSKPERA